MAWVVNVECSDFSATCRTNDFNVTHHPRPPPHHPPLFITSLSPPKPQSPPLAMHFTTPSTLDAVSRPEYDLKGVHPHLNSPLMAATTHAPPMLLSNVSVAVQRNGAVAYDAEGGAVGVMDVVNDRGRVCRCKVFCVRYVAGKV